MIFRRKRSAPATGARGWWENLYTGLTLRLAALMALYSLCRIAFYLFNRRFFADMTGGELARAMAGGLIFDVSAIGYLNLIWIQANLVPLRIRSGPGFQRVLGWVFFLTNALGLAANCLDMGYYPFALRRTTAAFFKEFSHEGGKLVELSGGVLLFGWPMALLWIALLVVIWRLIRSPRRHDPLASLRPGPYRLATTVLWLGLTFLLTIGLRGGTFSRFNRPITVSNATAYVDKPQHAAVVLNTPFSILRTLRQPALEKAHYFGSEAELASVYDPVHPARPAPPGAPLNVVVLVLESFGAEHIGALNPQLDGGAYKGFTPFLDGLMGQGLNFTNAFANGTKSIDALPSVVTSIPAVFESFVLSNYSTNRIDGLAALLHRRGYETLFFHGAPNGSMGLEAFTHGAGYDRYFGMREYGHDADFDGSWGIWDEEFFQFFARKLGEAKQPFLATIFSVSSHHPYKVPERYRGKFPKGPVEVEETMAYTDFALRRMFATMATLPYFDRTLFVITSDHASMQYRPEYQALVGRFRVPILLYRPDGSLRGQDSQPAQQIDILPTVMHLLGSEREYVAFGNDLLDQVEPARPRFAVLYTDGGMLQLVQGDYALHWDGRRVVGLYQYRNDPLLQHDLSATQPDVRARMERLVQAFVQQFKGRMIDDRLTVPLGARAAVAPK